MEPPDLGARAEAAAPRTLSWGDGERVLHRTSRADPGGGQRPVIIVTSGAENPTAAAVDRMTHEFGLRDHLHAVWAVRPLDLVRRQGRVSLVLDDPGAEPLEPLLGSPMETSRVLRLALALAAALRGLHEGGLIHKDINPANILVDEEAGRAWLTGFGVASRLPRERHAPSPPALIAGTLAYMSPEQTGRMNRSVDARSDLYALGVTLYQMLTGVLPFAAADPLEWIHCHIARQPVAPAARRAVPEPLSAITMRLLAKNAEERYQTAAGLEADLRRCLSQWRSHGRIDPFLLGADDASGRLLIPETLYGREREVEALLAAFDGVVARGTAQLVLVSGYSGVGKSSVVNELHKVLVPPRGLFAAGKFDQYKRDAPYATLAQAFQTLVRQILVESEEEVDPWRRAFLDALGPNGQLIVDLIPELEFVIGKQPPVVALPPQEARGRFQLVFRRFLGAFARPEHPLALFLDDLQWLDTASLDLLKHLITDPDVRHVLLIGAYRKNEVSPSDPLMRTLDAIRDAGAEALELVLPPLGLDDTRRLVAEALRCELEAADRLAQLVQEKAGGNPFFAIQFVTELEAEGLLRFEPSAAVWRWDVDRIRAKGYTANVVDLMVGKLSRLPRATQQSLKQLACLGNSAEFELLQTVYPESNDDIHDHLWEAVHAGLIFRSQNSYRFLHDRVQEAAYSLIPGPERAQTHLLIGRLLVNNTPEERREDIIFDIVSQFNLGSHLITEFSERERVANFNLIAGRRAIAFTAYGSALTYLRCGRSLLGDETWDLNYDLIFSIEYSMAECELHAADTVAAEERLTMLARRATSGHNLAIVTRLQVTLYTTLDRSDRAIDVFLGYLRRNGANWSAHPARDDVVTEYNRVWSAVGNRPIEDLLDMPLIHDPDVLDILDVFTEIVHPAIFFDENLSSLVVCRMVNICLKHGNCDASCFAYVWFGMFSGPRFNNYSDGFRFGQLGFDLVEQRNLTRYQARTYISFATLTPWAKHATKGRELVRRAFDVAHRTGDLTFSAYSWHVLITNYLLVGDPLSAVQPEVEKGLDFVKKAGFGLVAENCGAQLGLVRTLRGLTPTFGHLDADDYSEYETEHRLSSNSVLALAEFFYWTRKLQARFLAGDSASAVEASRKAYRLLWPAASQVETGEFRFYAALAHAAAWDSICSEEKQRYFAAVQDHHRELEIWARHCPDNFDTKAALVSAEIARIEGRVLDAEQIYEAAIRSARDNGFAHCEGVAHERAGQFYLARGLNETALVYLRDARDCYLRWGADAKVRQLEARHPGLAMAVTPDRRMTAPSPDQQLDVASVVKASQALSSEMHLPQLVERLMTITLQNAGADRGLLFLPQQHDYRIEAEALALAEGVVLRADVSDESAVPRTIIRYAIRTQDSVILADASIPNEFSEDPYLSLRKPRSVLCLPLVRQGMLGGLLYLENKLAPHVFTPERTRLLELLASQAAISLENAALYTDLQLQVGLLQQLPVSAWTLRPDGTPDFVNQVWLDFSGQTLDFVRSHPEAWMSVVHPEDREMAAKSFWEGVRSGRGFAFETRSLRARDGAYRRLLQQAVVLRDGEGKVLRFVGTTADIDDQKRAEETLRQAQSELAHVARVATLNAMTASIAHEISQPLSGILTNANTSLRMLAADPPNLTGVVEAARRTIRDAHRASEVLKRLRDMFSKKQPITELVDLNSAVRDVIAISAGELQGRDACLRTELTEGLPRVSGDHVQLQQVILNLLLNAADAMEGIEDRPRTLLVRTELESDDAVRVDVRDVGRGFDPGAVEKLFEPFHTTKANGMGIGLSICQSIIESHQGRLWATPNDGPGATFSFSIPLPSNPAGAPAPNGGPSNRG
jgi:PAS domain S-box-containing protein